MDGEAIHMKIRALVLALLIAAMFISAPTSGQAVPLTCTLTAPCTLATLISTPGEIIVEDKTFSAFTFAGGPPAASAIEVAGLVSGGNPALRFTGGFFAGPGAVVNVDISYTVMTAADLIADIQLIGNPTVTGTGFTEVSETVFEVGNLANTANASICAGSVGCALFDSALLPDPAAAVGIVKDVLLTGGTDGTATLSFVDQIVSQVPPPPGVPAPSTLFLLGSGLLGLTWFGRRKD
jgi:PEP-CTERM motif